MVAAGIKACSALNHEIYVKLMTNPRSQGKRYHNNIHVVCVPQRKDTINLVGSLQLSKPYDVRFVRHNQTFVMHCVNNLFLLKE